jgi:hypothetical protein
LPSFEAEDVDARVHLIHDASETLSGLSEKGF